jgi:hypothetical protein
MGVTRWVFEALASPLVPFPHNADAARVERAAVGMAARRFISKPEVNATPVEPSMSCRE